MQDILTNFEFRNQIPRLSKADALGQLIEKFLDKDINLSPQPVGDLPGLDNHSMGTMFEELVRRFNEENNEEAGEHWTPRDAVRLMANLMFLPVADKIESGTYLLYDCACGTGGMLTVAEETLQQIAKAHGKQVATHLYGQEINGETYAICKADLLLKGDGDAADNIVGGPEHSTLANDAFRSREFDFMLANPPYGKSWKSDLERMGGKKDLKDPRFVIQHAGESEYSLITRTSDGQMLFLANMLSKMKHDTPLGSRIAEVHNGSSLFTGDAGQGESNIRRWIIENDWLEAIVALPLNMFYNTGIATYVWVLTNRKPEHRQGKVQLIDATQWFRPLRKNMGKKNCELAAEDIQRICDTFLAFKETPQSKIFPNAAFGYWKVKVERPLRLHSQLTRQRIETLRFASGDEDIRAALYEKLGDALFENPASVREELEKLVNDWGNGESDEDDEEGESRDAKKSPAGEKEKEAPQRSHLEARRDACRCRHQAPRGPRRRSLRRSQRLPGTRRSRAEETRPQTQRRRPQAHRQRRQLARGRRAPRHQESPQARQSPARPVARPVRSRRSTARPASSNTSPTANCATSSKSRCWRKAASKPSSAAKCCPTRPTRGSSRPTPRSATKSASPATSTSRRSFAPSPRSAPTSSRWSRRPKACSPKSPKEPRHDRGAQAVCGIQGVGAAVAR